MTTREELEQLTSGGETLTVEFKGESRHPLRDADLVDAVVCLANTKGGVILIGVEDDGTVTGARPRHGTYTDVRRVEALIANHTVPSCPVDCEVFDHSSGQVVVLKVPAGRPVTATTGGAYRRRALDVHGKPQCRPMLPHEIQSREGSRGAQDYSALPVAGARWEDLDPLEFERLRQTIQRNPGRADATLLTLDDMELVKALGIAQGDDGVDRILVAGLLLLGREEALRRLMPTHDVAFQVLSGTRVVVNDFFRWPLIRVSDELTARFDARNEEEELMIGAVRAGIPDYSRQGFREAVHNALVHRDYASRGEIHVFWRDEELEITSPGGFPDDVNLGNLLVVAPRPRNPVLADAFKRIGLVDRTGRGIDTIYEGQLRYGRSAPDYSRSSVGNVQVVLPGGPANLALARFIIERDRPERPVTVDDMLLVNAIDRERRISIERAAQLMQKGEAAARGALERLVEGGVLEGRRDGRERVYLFSPATYRAIGPASAYTRASGFEPIQQEQMVLSQLRAHGRITKAEVVELCQASQDRARYLLRRLVGSGKIRLHGSGRSAWYELVPEKAGTTQ